MNDCLRNNWREDTDLPSHILQATKSNMQFQCSENTIFWAVLCEIANSYAANTALPTACR